ncbi:MAG TPA: carboxypeptidase-like regulatory domain-containing protein, partial [Saprospiraceae bacterium]|nr:carboxypeptidase-like regulatory domain-containing protein [Saprospiraceae bacterium]
ELRCTDRLIRLDSVLISPGKKLILSLSDSIQDQHISTTSMPTSLTQDEKNNLYRYIFPFRYKDNAWDYIEQKGAIQLLQPASGTFGRQLTGPIMPDVVQYRNLRDNHKIDFAHEPMMEYDFAPGLLKMRSVNPEWHYPDKLSGAAREEWGDLVWKKEDLLPKFKSKQWSEYWYINLAPYTITLSGRRGRLQLDGNFTNKYPDKAYVLLFKYENPDFVLIQSAYYKLFHNLGPGNYRAIWLLQDGRYFVKDSIGIEANGINYLRIDSLDILPADDFSKSCKRSIERDYIQRWSLLEVRENYIGPTQFTGPERLFIGSIKDDKGEPLIGAAIKIKGQARGTVTDFDGQYSLLAPEDAVFLISYLGFESMEVRPSAQSDFVLHSADYMLSEVLVSAYKSDLVQQDRVSTGYSVSLSNRKGRDFSSKLAGIQVRGSRSDATEYYIDGVRVSGELLGLSSDQIQNIEVISDSAARAVFGPGGAEVVL